MMIQDEGLMRRSFWTWKCQSLIVLIILFSIQVNSFGQGLSEMEELLEKQQEQINLVLFGAMVPIVLAFIFFVFIFYRIKREEEFRKKEYSLRFGRAEMELKALKAQVNPHFIFNCLTSIQNFLKKNDSLVAEEFLIKFSRLIREVLENSEHSFIPLQEDLETLENYVAMEQIRTDNKFQYNLSIDPEIDQSTYSIPPLLIQPLVENSIWHGISSGGGKIEVQIILKNDFFLCRVLDNGETQSTQSRSVYPFKKSSFGMKLIKERIDLFNQMNGTEARIDFFEDEENVIKPWSKMVELMIPYKTKIEEK